MNAANILKSIGGFLISFGIAEVIIAGGHSVVNSTKDAVVSLKAIHDLDKLFEETTEEEEA